MAPEVLTAIVSAAGAVVAAVAGYVFTKRAEREAEWRKEKLDRYKAFVASLSGTIEGETSLQGQEAFAHACNNILLFAPRPVIDALQRFRDEIRVSNPNKSIERHDQLLADLLFEIRNDLGLRPRDDRSTLRVQLWAVGKSHFEPVNASAPDHSLQRTPP